MTHVLWGFNKCPPGLSGFFKLPYLEPTLEEWKPEMNLGSNQNAITLDFVKLLL